MRTADIVIIGAGIQGLSAAYHLAKKGVKRIVVLEKEYIGAGSSGRSASMLKLQVDSEIEIAMSLHSFERYMAFEDELGVDPEFQRIGFLNVAVEKKALDVLKAAKRRQERGIQTEILGPEDVRRLVPVVNTADIVVGVYGAQDGVIDPHAIMGGYKEGAQRHGTEVCQGQEYEVVGIEMNGDRVTGVRTRSEMITTETIVNAAGAGAAQVASWAGITLPITNWRRNIFVTEPFSEIPDDTPMVKDAEVEWYYRKEGPGVLMGMGNEQSSEIAMAPNMDYLNEVAEFAVHRAPIFENARYNYRKGWSGLRSLTPDKCPIIGPVDEVRGFFNTCGWGGIGVMHAPAGGQMVAECIVDGQTSIGRPEQFLAARF